MVIETKSEQETERVGERIGSALVRGAVVGLIGPLGAGKTVLVRGIARACGVDEASVRSPTFITAAEYQGTMPFAHIDLYRHDECLPDPDWLAELLDRDGVAVVEWYDRLDAELVHDALVVELALGKEPDRRRLTLGAYGPRAEHVLAAVSEAGATG
jgi:tRNA threonylcarbamoyladenosine biosynthesis protein TsaE